MPRGRPGRTPRAVNQTVAKVKDPRFDGYNLPGPGPGRPKGSRNKVSGDLKALILQALANAHNEGDEVDYLIEQARQVNPSPFMSLVGKCITQEVVSDNKHEVTVNLKFID